MSCCAFGGLRLAARSALPARRWLWCSSRGLDFAYRAPALHVALETTAAIAASAAAFLLLGRFWRTGFLDELILSAGLSRARLSNLAFAALSRRFGLQSGRASGWSMLYTGVLAAPLICAAALLPRRRLAVGPRWALRVFGGAAALALAGTLPMAAVPACCLPASRFAAAGTAPPGSSGRGNSS